MIKTRLLLSIVACISFSTVMAEEAAKNDFEPFTGKVIGSKVRIRTQPNFKSDVVCSTSTGELLAVVGCDNDFYIVKPKKGIKGYVFRSFVLDNIVEVDRVNVRLHPDLESPIIAKLNVGYRIEGSISPANNKWLEVDIQDIAQFYISKDYIEKVGPAGLFAQSESRNREASHILSAAFLFAQSQIQSPFEQIDFDSVSAKFDDLVTKYSDLPDVVGRAKEALSIIQEIYVQKKIAFLEGKAQHLPINDSLNPDQINKLAKIGINIQPTKIADAIKNMNVAYNTSKTIGASSVDVLGSEGITDKMLSWQPLEESLFHVWSVSNNDLSIDDFYIEEKMNATTLTGIVEEYNRPVKNRPGDYLLRSESLPVAFLYSTHVNLQNLVGKKISLTCSPRPNNNFAFPAYYVLSIE